MIANSPHGFKIAENAGAEPLLVGYRYGSRLKNKIHHISLCLGPDWYSSACGPFLKASEERKRSFTVKYRSAYPDKNGRCIRVIDTTRSRLGTTFEMIVPGLVENMPTLQQFEWRHRQAFQLRDQEPDVGTILTQHSTTQMPQVVARIKRGERKPHRVLTGDFEIVFIGASTAYGGSWKVAAFVIGILAFC